MTTELLPVLEQWYRHRGKGQLFRVVAVDESEGAIEIQNFDGDVEELDREGWREADIELAEAPEDWTGPFDEIETDDRGYSETAVGPTDWRACLETLRPTEERWREARVEEEMLSTSLSPDAA